MPERVYMNRRTGEERIHIEITYGEIQELLTRPAGEPTRQLWQLLATAHRQFNESTPAPELTDIDRERAADEHETATEHARGEHEHCGPTCETEFPGSALRNFILAKGYPGTAGALDELLRRASTTGPEPLAEQPGVSRALVYRELADEQEATATTDVIRRRRSIATARRLFAVELRRKAEAVRDCPSCEVGIEHAAHCPTPESHNWGCGCTTDEKPLAVVEVSNAGSEPPFLIAGCTCRPWTRRERPPRLLDRPTDTVDMISGFERGSDCPHHAAAEGAGA
ncbi:hypothetical protein ACFWIB_15395 [Streptomyces sp. NPDC127051]|uniref:hypothetical protein n=1 Tax=Streptomyces sp. NPDC127051 TaxID=3347119 RepID=UPI0036510E5E